MSQRSYRLMFGCFAAALSISFSGPAAGASVLHFHQFAEDFSLTAHARQTVILDTHPGDRAEARIPYELEKGKHKFCLEGRDPYFTGLILEDSEGKTIFTMPGYERCAAVTLPKGAYTLRVPHSVTLLADPARLGRVEVDAPGPPLLQPGNPAVPVLGFWAIQLDPALDSRHRPGRLRIQLPFKSLPPPAIPGAWYPVNSATPVVADFGSQQMDQYSLFHIPPVVLGGLPSAPNPYPEAVLPSAVGSGTYTWDVYPFMQGKTQGYQLIIDSVDPSISSQLVFLNDLGNYDATFGAYLCFAQNEFSNEAFVAYTQGGACTNPKFHVAFRFFLDPRQIGGLHEGEAALFQQCGYQGRAAVFAGGTQDLSALDSPAITIDNSAQSVQLGNNTAVMWQTPASEPAAIASDSPCLAAGRDNSPQGHDFQVLPLNVLLSSSPGLLNKKCVKCKLHNVSLNGTDLRGFDLSGADFSGATLNNVKLNNATLAGANFTGATFSCVDLSGTDQNHLTDLTQVSFTNTQWAQNLACPGSLFYTRLSSQMHPLDVSSWTLAGVSLEGAALDYATGLAGRDLTQIVLSGASLQHVNLSQAKLYGAHLNGVNFDGANLSGAFLTKSSGNIPAANLAGAFLRNVNLSKAQLDGANLTNASFYGTVPAGLSTCAIDPATGFTNACASAAGATMNNTQFSSAYLFGVDFTGAQIQGVQFGNAVLVGANFANATLSLDKSVGTNTGFSGAFLQGTNLATAASLAGISLAYAFVDFSPQGNVLYLILNGQHTTFPGYWNTSGQAVCTEMAYAGPTAAPVNNSTITCPDAKSYPNGCGTASVDGSNARWKSPVDINQVASYQYNATYTEAPTSGNAICAYDRRWILQGLSQQPVAPHPPKPKKSRRGSRRTFDYRRSR